MQKIISTIIIILLSLAVDAQIPNNGFELVDSNGAIENWSRAYMFPVWSDSNGVFHTDTILMNGPFYRSSRDAHGGRFALEMENAHNLTRNEGIAGAADLKTLPDPYAGFGNGVPVTRLPGELRFWYKFVPAGPDTAQALLTVYDSSGDESGRAEILITAATSGYTLAAAQVVYQRAEAAAVSLSFSASKSSENAHAGTRFIVDDINLDALGVPTLSRQPLRCYPTIATDELIIENAEPGVWQLYSEGGQLIRHGNSAVGGTWKLETQSLSPGVYYLSLQCKSIDYVGRFTKR